MVLLPQLSPDAFQTLKHSEKGRSSALVRHSEGLQDERGQDHREIHLELLLQQLQRSHPSPFNHNHIVHNGKSAIRRRRKMP